MENRQATLELGTKPVGKLLAQYTLPAIIAMTASSLYNMVDSIFIGQAVGPMAISGLAITFPFMNLSGAFGAAIGVGAATSISVKLGQKDYHVAENILGNTVTLTLVVGIAFTVVCLSFLDPILRFLERARHASLCTRLHGNHLAGQRVHPHVYEYERCAKSRQQAQASHVRHYFHRGT